MAEFFAVRLFLFSAAWQPLKNISREDTMASRLARNPTSCACGPHSK